MANPAILPAGELRHRIAFLGRTVTVKSGVTTETFGELFQAWAKVETVSAREYFTAAADNREDTVRFTIRYRTDVTAEMTIRYEGRTYNIESVTDPGGRHVKLEIAARSEVPAE